MARLSVIVPVYNVEDYIDRCLESLVCQSLSDIEILCVNDGSTDESPAHLRKWVDRDERIRVVSKPNGGLSSARNTGIAKASAKYVCFVDSDDRLYVNACEDIVRMMDESNADVLTFGATCVPGEAVTGWLYDVLSPRNITYNSFDPDILFKESSRPFAWRMACNTDFLRMNNILFDEDVRFGEDQIFCFAVYPRASKIRFSSMKLYEYLAARPGSLMDRMNADICAKMLEHINIVDHIFSDWSNLGILDSYAEQMMRWAIDFCLYELIRVPQDKFLEVTDKLGAVLRSYIPIEYVKRVEDKVDRAYLNNLLQPGDANLYRRKCSAIGFYERRFLKRFVYRWALTDWYLK